MPAKLNFFKTPASVRLVSSRTVSTSTGISGCYQPHRQTAMLGQKSIYETFLEFILVGGRMGRRGWRAGSTWENTILYMALKGANASENLVQLEKNF